MWALLIFLSPNWKFFNQFSLPAYHLASQGRHPSLLSFKIYDAIIVHCLLKKKRKTRTLEREKNKNEKAFSIIGCAWNYKYCRFLTMWRPRLPNTTLAIAWQVFESFLTTSWWLPDNCNFALFKQKYRQKQQQKMRRLNMGLPAGVRILKIWEITTSIMNVFESRIYSLLQQHCVRVRTTDAQ